VEVLETTLENIDERVISIWIGGSQEEARLEHEVPGVADNAFDHLPVVEVDAHPEARHDGRMLVKVKSPVAQIPIEGLDEEDRLRILGGDILHDVRVQKLQPDRVQGIDGIVAEKLFNRTKLLGFRETANCMVFIADDDTIRVGRFFFGDLGSGLGLYDAWLFRGDRSYCLILYRSAL
jgi:hypothetical protein